MTGHAALQRGIATLAKASVHGVPMVVEPHGPEVVGIIAPIPAPEEDRPGKEPGVLVIVSVQRFHFNATGVPAKGKRFVDRATGESYRILEIEDVMPRPFIAFTCRAGRVTEDAP